MTQVIPDQHTPPLGFKILTPLYDAAIALLTREGRWRSAFVETIDPQADDVIVDVGSGTGSLAVAVLRRQPQCNYLGIDPDREAIQRARRKLARKGLTADFAQGYLEHELFAERPRPVKIVSSLVLHQVPLTEKSRILNTIYDALGPAGVCHIADYGHQRTWLSKFLFRITVQLIDGTTDTQPNADGILPDLLKEAGFEDVEETRRIATPTGVISFYRGVKPGNLIGAAS